MFEKNFIHTNNMSLTTLMIEGYMDFVIMAVLSVHSLIYYSELSFWATPWDILSSSGTIMSCFVLVFYPIYGAI